MIPLRDSHPAAAFPFWVLLIIVTNVYVFFLEITSSNPDAFITQYALIPALVDLSRLEAFFPFVTSQFLHGGFLHIISNMLFLWVFGDNVEGKLGHILFPFFYLLGGVAGGFAQYLLMPDSQIPMLGASGAIAGVLGAYFAYFPHHKIKTLVTLPGFFTTADLPASIMLVYWFVSQIFSQSIALTASADMGGVAYMAHIGGFAAGWILAKLLPSRVHRLEPV